MSFRCNPVLTSGLLLSLVVGTALGGAAQAADLSVRPYLRPVTATALGGGNGAAAMAAATGTEVGANVNARGAAQASAAPANAAVSHARAARARFSEARAVMEQALLLREAAPKSNAAALDAAMNGLAAELMAIEASGASRWTDAVNALVQDWYQSGVKIINPPAGGVLELPMPTTVARKADKAATALDQIIEEVSVRAAVPHRAIKPRVQPGPQPVASAPAAASIASQ